MHTWRKFADRVKRSLAPDPSLVRRCLEGAFSLWDVSFAMPGVGITVGATEEIAEDARLPGELEVADQYGVSRDTIRRAIQELVSEDRLMVLHGRGMFVKHQA